MKEENKNQITLSELVTPQMANFAGNLFGGALLALMDKAAYVCARRYCREYCVTASFDQVSFIAPVHIGELINIYAKVVYAGRSSMSINISVIAENLNDGSKRKVSTCLVTMVAVKDNKPVKVPEFKINTEEEKAEYEKAKIQKELIKEYAKKIREIEDS